mmetsp:Transcript_42691/g.129681  ORF Transcript_42691/g.129681 Transcript_42691/m.129681 type:complete len:294 (-) Transcript_42691:138-1019(-)
MLLRGRISSSRHLVRVLGAAAAAVFLLFLTVAAGAVDAADADAAAAADVDSEEVVMPRITIGIAGGTGAGKSTLARAVYRELGGPSNVTYLMHDDYYRDLSHLPVEERARTNFDHPDSLETDLLVRHLRDLKEGKSVDAPRYDFSVHSRTSEVIRTRPKSIVLVEGILIFSEPELVDQLDVKVFVDADSDIRLMRRIARDTSERGRSVDEVMEQYKETVRPMHEEFVEPSKSAADVVVHSEGHGDVALRMIVNHLRAEAGLLPPSPTGDEEAQTQTQRQAEEEGDGAGGGDEL